MFQNSTVHHELEAGRYGSYVLIGDSGYNSKQTFLCTPFSARDKPNEANWTDAERDYHRALIQTRNTIERAFGLLKRRFPVCAFGMRLRRLDVAQKIVTACFMFHNICLDMGDAGMHFSFHLIRSIYFHSIGSIFSRRLIH